MITLLLIIINIGLRTNPVDGYWLMSHKKDPWIDDDCTLLKYGNGTNIFAIGLTNSKNILMITRDYYFVYEMNLDSIDTINHRLYMLNDPKRMSARMPRLWFDIRFEKLFHQMATMDTFTVIDITNMTWICLVSKPSPQPLRGINYELTEGKTLDGWFWWQQWTQTYVTTAENNSFYSIRYVDANSSTEICKFRISDDSPIANLPAWEMVEPWRSICITSKYDRLRILSGAYDCSRFGLTKAYWFIARGFLFDQNFYLFGNKSVIIFSVDAYQKDQDLYPITKRTYSEFFQCRIDSNDVADKIVLVSMIIILIYVFSIVCCILILHLAGGSISLLFGWSKTVGPVGRVQSQRSLSVRKSLDRIPPKQSKTKLPKTKTKTKTKMSNPKRSKSKRKSTSIKQLNKARKTSNGKVNKTNNFHKSNQTQKYRKLKAKIKKTIKKIN